MKATVFILMLCATVLTCKLQAQTGDGAGKLQQSTSEQRAQMQSTMMKDELKLSEAQYKQVSALNLEYAKKMQPIIDGDGGKLSRAKKAKALFKEKESRLKPLLTNEQYKLYQDKVKAMLEAVKQAHRERKW